MSYEVKPLNELLQEKKQQRGGEGAKDVQKPSSAGEKDNIQLRILFQNIFTSKCFDCESLADFYRPYFLSSTLVGTGFRRLRLPKKTEKVALDSVCVELATTAECTRHESTIAARGASQSPDLVQSNETR